MFFRHAKRQWRSLQLDSASGGADQIPPAASIVIDTSGSNLMQASKPLTGPDSLQAMLVALIPSSEEALEQNELLCKENNISPTGWVSGRHCEFCSRDSAEL